MSLGKKIVRYSLLFLAIALVLFIVSRKTNKIFKCERLQVGDRFEKIVELLGTPYKQDRDDKSTRYYFESGIFAAGPIRVETKLGKVTSYRCSED